MRQACCFWVSRRAACEEKHSDFVRAKMGIEFFNLVFQEVGTRLDGLGIRSILPRLSVQNNYLLQPRRGIRIPTQFRKQRRIIRLPKLKRRKQDLAR